MDTRKMELTMDEMTDVAGGINMDAAIKHLVKAAKESSPACTNPGGHNWVYTHHEEEENTLLGFIPWGTKGYNYFECTFCHATKKEHV